jgi:hypothetical protein
MFDPCLYTPERSQTPLILRYDTALVLIDDTVTDRI